MRGHESPHSRGCFARKQLGLAVFLVGAAVWVRMVLQTAREPAAAETPGQPRIVIDVSRVNLPFTVTDGKGRFVAKLTQDDFQFLENKRPRRILEFGAETGLPPRLAVLVDSGDSVRDRFRFIQEAAIEFLKDAIRPRVDEAALVSFDTVAELVTGMTGDLEALTTALRDLRLAGGTAVYDAAYFACRDTLQMYHPRHEFRRAMVILSDGEDNRSRVTRDQALEVAQQADAAIHAVSTNITRIETGSDKVLKYFASEAGGVSFFPFKARDLSRSFDGIANELRRQYTLLYRPETLNPDGRYHKVEVLVKGRGDLVVRARKGYYAPVVSAGKRE